MSRQPVVAVDYDGTICEFRYPESGPLKEGVVEALRRIRSCGYKILIYSCRTRIPDLDLGITPEVKQKAFKDMVDYLKANNVPYDEIDMGKDGKPFADFYIDDKGITFSDNWREIASYIEFVTFMVGATKGGGRKAFYEKPEFSGLAAVGE